MLNPGKTEALLVGGFLDGMDGIWPALDGITLKEQEYNLAELLVPESQVV